MTTITLADIQIAARKESYRMQHHYIGVEHLFIGMLEISGSIASQFLNTHGLTGAYVADLIRRHIGKGAAQHQWAGMPSTPRADVVMSIAHDLALETGEDGAGERELLMAMLEENASIPAYILTRLGLNTAEMREAIRVFDTMPVEPPALVTVEIAPHLRDEGALSPAHIRLLRQMFRPYDRVRVERRLRGGYTGALLLLVTPLGMDGHADSPIVVKIDCADRILEEAQRYESQVKNTLPPLTARLEDDPVMVEGSRLAGLKYTFVANSDEAPADLRAAAASNTLAPDVLGVWLKEQLFPTFGKTWWMQRRAFRFPVWTEYDWLLPPMLILERDPDPAPGTPRDDGDLVMVIHEPIRRQRIAELQYGDRVAVENFTVRRVHPENDTVQLTFGKGSDSARRAYKIEVREARLGDDAFYRREQVERISGCVYETRAGLLLNAIQSLEPPFNPLAQTIPGLSDTDSLPNPLFAYDALLDRAVTGAYSRIHGDLNLGNIVLGPANAPFLIDFAEARAGHTLFDWACLEVSLLADVVLPTFPNPESWGTAWDVLRQLAAIHALQHKGSEPDTRGRAFAPVRAVIDIAVTCLTNPNDWAEYYVALAFCALRAATWETMHTGGRRLMVGVSALALHLLNTRRPANNDSMTEADTDLTDML